MSLFDILKNADFGSAIDMITSQMGGAGSGIGSTLGKISSQVRAGASSLGEQTPGGLGGLLGAGALGAVLGNVMNSNLVKGVAMAGATAVAWNFYKKWAAGQDAQAAAEEAAQAGLQGAEKELPSANVFGSASSALPADPTVELILRTMIYSAKADGKIDALEEQRINEILGNLLPGENVRAMIDQVSREAVDPGKIAALVRSDDQARDVYRLSCAVIDIDEFMERNYLDALAKSLRISQDGQRSLEKEADMARKQLLASLPR